MLKKIFESFTPDPAKQEHEAFLRNLAASDVFVNTITDILNPDRGIKLDADLAQDTILHLANKWIAKHGRGVFPNMDEFEIKADLVVQHPDHDQREEHQRFNLRQLSAWVDTQKHHENI